MEVATSLNDRIDQSIKHQKEQGFNELDLNTTATSIEEGRKLISDRSALRYSSMDELKAALDV